MFNVVDKETGIAVTVFGVNGHFFLIYDDRYGWGYKHMDCFRPVKPEDWEVWNGSQ